jgi:DNA-binding XRE family transcriptional regulator
MRGAETEARLLNYIRCHRRRTGLSQRELGEVLGYLDEDAIARHEQFLVTPPLEIAIGYQRIFGVPVSELFAGLSDEMAERIETRLLQLELRLGQRSVKDRNALATARKLAWLAARRDADLEATP